MTIFFHKLGTKQLKANESTELEKAIKEAGVEKNKNNIAILANIFKTIKEYCKGLGKTKPVDFYNQRQVESFAHKLAKQFKKLTKSYPDLDFATFGRMSWAAALHAPTYCTIALDQKRQDSQKTLFCNSIQKEIKGNDDKRDGARETSKFSLSWLHSKKRDEDVDGDEFTSDETTVLNDNVLFRDNSAIRQRSGSVGSDVLNNVSNEVSNNEENSDTEILNDNVLVNNNLEITNVDVSVNLENRTRNLTAVVDNMLDEDQSIFSIVNNNMKNTKVDVSVKLENRTRNLSAVVDGMLNEDQHIFSIFNEQIGEVHTPEYILQAQVRRDGFEKQEHFQLNLSEEKQGNN